MNDWITASWKESWNGPESADLIVITGSRKNVTQWENEWMQELSLLVQCTNTPLLGICFGHQIICHALGGKSLVQKKPSEFITDTLHQ